MFNSEKHSDFGKIFKKKLSLSPFTLQVGSLNACFLAKRGFNVEVFEAREGSSLFKNSLYNIAPSLLSLRPRQEHLIPERHT